MNPNYNAQQQAPGQHPHFAAHQLHMLRMMNPLGIYGHAPAPALQHPPQHAPQHAPQFIGAPMNPHQQFHLMQVARVAENLAREASSGYRNYVDQLLQMRNARAPAPAPPALGAPAPFHLGAPGPAPPAPRAPMPFHHAALGAPAPLHLGAPAPAHQSPRAQNGATPTPEEPRARADAPRAPRVQTPPPQAPHNVRSQEDQELMSQLTAENEKLKMDSEVEKIKNRVLWKCHQKMDAKIKEMEKKMEKEMELKKKVEQENRELKKRLGEVEQNEEQAPGPSEPRRRAEEGEEHEDEEPPRKTAKRE